MRYDDENFGALLTLDEERELAKLGNFCLGVRSMGRMLVIDCAEMRRRIADNPKALKIMIDTIEGFREYLAGISGLADITAMRLATIKQLEQATKRRRRRKAS